KLREAATGDELLGLNEELDLADAAPAKLDVVALHRDLAMPLVGMDLALDGMDVGNGRIVHIFAPDIGPQLLQEGLPRLDVARQRPGLDHGGALPVLAARLIIGQGRPYGDSQRGRAGVRTQAQIGAEYITMLGAVLHDAYQPAGKARKDIPRLHRVAGHGPGIEEEN